MILHKTLLLQTVHSFPSSLKSRWILYKTLLLQTVHSPLLSSPKSRWILHKTLLLQLFTNSPAVQRVQQNFQPNTEPANCSQPFQLPKVHQNSPPKPTSTSCSQPPHFPRVQQDHQSHPAPPSSRQPTQTKPYPPAAFNLHRNLKLRQNSISTQLSRQ